MPKFSVRKSIHIAAPIDKVYATVRDFRQWRAWSPWLICEPSCEVTYADDGKSYTWTGAIVGAGEMTISGESPPRSIDYDLHFLKPWKSHASVRFIFAEANGGTEATWTMDSSLPFFLFWMKTMMVGFIGMDYARGLGMLKDYIETGSVPSKLEFPGVRSVPACTYIGVRSQSSLDDVGPSMRADLAKLESHCQAHAISPSGKPFAIYHQWDMAKQVTDYTIGFPMAAAVQGVPEGFVCQSAPPCEAYVVRHTGSYRHLGNPWAAGIMHARSKQFAGSKKIPPFEVYESSPDDTPESDLVTVVHFPLK